MMFFFWGVMLGPYIKFRVYQGHQNVRAHHNGNLLGLIRLQQGKTFNYRTAYLPFQLSSHPYLCTCKIKKQSNKKFFNLNPKYEEKTLFFIFGGPGGGDYVEPR